MTDQHSSVIAFDLDNTLLDPEGTAYGNTVHGLLEACDIGLPPDEAYDAFEEVRATGRALQRIGLSNPIHDRAAPDALAVFLMTQCASDSLRSELRIQAEQQAVWRDVLEKLDDRHTAAAKGAFAKRLEAECRVRRFCKTDPRVAAFRDESRRIAACSRVEEWSRLYRAIEGAQPVPDHRAFLESLVARGALPVVITEGPADTQGAKLNRLGLNDSVPGRTFISHVGGEVPGRSELDAAIDRLIDARFDDRQNGDEDELSFLWYFRCVLDRWSKKSPDFYARCLHAIQSGSARPSDTFHEPVYVPRRDWAERPQRFVMVGDKYAKDIAPIQELLGRGVGMTIRLRTGKYGGKHIESDLPPEARPTRTFVEWDVLARFLIHEFDPPAVEPIREPPALLARADVNETYLAGGLSSSFEAVRRVAAVLDAMVSDSGER